MYDVIIIGAGVSGCAAARELSKTKRNIAVLERASDVCEGTSKANSGIVHAGFDAAPGTRMAKLNVEGNALMEEYARALDIPFRRNGSLVLCFDEAGRAGLTRLLENGAKNGVPELRIVEQDELRRLEPQVSPEALCALYAPTGGIVCPFTLTIALAENACENGVEFHLNTAVTAIERTAEGYRLITNRGAFLTRMLVNAAGVYADKLHNMVSADTMTIVPRKGEYCLFDKKCGTLTGHTLFQLPGALGKGVLVTPTVHGNLLVGPNASDIADKEGVQTTQEGLEEILQKASKSVKNLPTRQIITAFAGLRAHRPEHDFYIQEAPGAPGFIDVAGIESPGLTSAPAIGRCVAELVQEISPAPDKEDFVAERKGVPNMAEASPEEKQALIAKDPAFASVVCRCETVTEGEILAAIRRPLGATTVDGVKRRTRAGMGRCQAGFCSPRTVELLARERGCDLSEITKAGGASRYLTGFTKMEDLT